MNSTTNLTRRLSIWEPPVEKPKKVVFKFQSSKNLTKANTNLSLSKAKSSQSKLNLQQAKAVKPALKYHSNYLLDRVAENLAGKLPTTATTTITAASAATTTITAASAATTTLEGTALKENAKAAHKIERNQLKGKPLTHGYRYLNEGIISQCRKWERLQERASALEKHKKLLHELRWKMALNNSSKKSFTGLKVSGY